MMCACSSMKCDTGEEERPQRLSALSLLRFTKKNICIVKLRCVIGVSFEEKKKPNVNQQLFYFVLLLLMSACRT